MSAIDTLRVRLDVASSLTPLLDEAGRVSLRDHVLQILVGMLQDLGIPIEPELEVRLDQPTPAFGLTIDGQPARLPRSPSAPPTSVRGLTLRVAEALFENREQLVGEPVIQALRERWRLAETATFLSALSREDFRSYLRKLVRYGFRVDAGQALRDSRSQPLDRWTADECFERATAPLGNLRVLLFHGPNRGADPPLDEALKQMRDAFFYYEIGIRVPSIQVAEDRTLEPLEWRVQGNSLRCPPFMGLAANEFLVNDTVDRLKLLEISGRSTINPANGSEGAIVTDDGGAAIRCKSAGLTIWSAAEYAALVTNAYLRRQAGALIVGAGVDYELERLGAAGYPELVRAARARFSISTLTQVLRELADDEINVRNLPAVLEALLAIRGGVTVDVVKRIVFTPYATAPCLLGPSKPETLEAPELAECVRGQLKRLITYKYAKGATALVVYLVDPVIERRVCSAEKEPLDDAERAELHDAIEEEVKGLPPSAQSPVILTALSTRRPLQQL